MNSVASVVLDRVVGFEQERPTLAIALDLKEICNAVVIQSFKAEEASVQKLRIY